MDEISRRDQRRIVNRTSRLAAAYLSRNALVTSDVPKLIADIHSALSALETPSPREHPEGGEPRGQVEISQSILDRWSMPRLDTLTARSARREALALRRRARAT